MSIRLLHRTYGLFFLLALVAALITLGMPVLRANSQSDGYSDYAGGSKGQITVVLHADTAPAPGGIANFSFAMTPMQTAPDLTVTWTLPDGGELLGGAAEEQFGAVAAGATVTQTRQLRFPNPGIYEVQVRASYHPDAATTFSAKGVLFFTIDANGSTASDADPTLEPYVPPTDKPTVDKAGMAVAAGAWGTNVPDGCFAVSGFLSREDRQGVPSPASYVDTPGSAMPVRNFLVEMREEDTFSDDSYGHTVTNALGQFTFNFCDDDGFLNDELELYYRVCSIVLDGHEVARIEQTSRDDLYCWDSGNIDSEGGNINFPDPVYKVDTVQAAVFNIGDAIFWATKYWNDNLNPGVPRMDRSVTVNWDRATKFAGAFYTDSTDTMTLGDDVSDPDEWDDTVIIHEWGHFADEQFSCNGSPGGNHNLTATNKGPNGDKLAWGEGYGDYIQSAVRTIMPGVSNEEFYIDVDTAVVDLETVANANVLSESGIASLLWDFVDTANDGSDTVNHGPARITQVLTDPAFKSNPACNMVRFVQVWKDLSMPTDAATADTIIQNVKIAKPFGVVAAVAASAGNAPLSLANLQALDAAPPQEYRWWDQVTMVVDDSTSMGQPAEAPKINAVKTLIQEQVADLTANPKGTEVNIYRFNADSILPTPVGEGLFFPARVNAALDTLQPTGADNGCPTYGLYALSQAIQDKYDGQAWLYTDGDAAAATSVDYIQQQLNMRQINGSIVLLGGCSSAPTDERSVTGPEVNFLGNAATGLETAGIVPYLLTAIGTGGNFLYVGPDQLADATDILRAQASHSAGAGKWSDYVSVNDTYRWDKLASWEYNWINPVVNRGSSVPDDLIIDGLPTMTVYGSTYNKVHVTDYGVIGMGNPATPGNSFSRDLYPLFNFDMQWELKGPKLASTDSPDAPNGDYVQDVYADDTGEWVVITITGSDGASNGYRTFQALINKNNGEIRYQYKELASGDSAGAIIGVSQSDFTIGFGENVYASVDDVNGATPNMGYKFIPAPPQPTKSYNVVVDSQMSGVGFLLTGYSGYVGMTIVDPDGNTLSCADTANVLCLAPAGSLVQYVQVNVNGNGGTYVATVSGEGTFSFNAMAASAIQAKGLGKRTQSFDPNPFQLDFGRTSDDGTLEGWLQTATGASFGSAFTFYDDGAHNDGEAGDGLFGSDAFSPPAQGVGYLWVRGNVNGESITRSDPAPYNFQPIKVEPALPYVQAILGTPVTFSFIVTNQDSVAHCYNWEVEVPTRFIFQGSSGGYFCVSAGGTAYPNATFTHIEDGLIEGGTAEFNANFYEAEEGRIVGGATTTVAFVNRLGEVEFDNREVNTRLRPNGTDTVTMSVKLLDNFGDLSGWSGALEYSLDTTLGTVIAPTVSFENGILPVVFTSGTTTGTALITFVLEGGSTTTTTLQISDAVAKEIDLVVTPTDLRGDGQDSAEMVATLRDAWGDPVVGQSVRLSISDDDGREVNGAINGESVLMATTDANGKVSATFTKGTDLTFLATVHAEALVPDGSGFRVTAEDAETLLFSGEPPGSVDSPNFFIPFLAR